MSANLKVNVIFTGWYHRKHRKRTEKHKRSGERIGEGARVHDVHVFAAARPIQRRQEPHGQRGVRRRDTLPIDPRRTGLQPGRVLFASSVDIDCNFRIWCVRNFYTSVGLARRPHIDRTCSEHAVGVSCIPSEPQEREARPRAKASRRQGIREAICPALRAIGDIMSNGCVGNFHIPDEMPGGRDGHICGIGAG